MSLLELVGRLEKERDRHVTGSPSSEEELRRLELTLGRHLPPSFRTFLAYLGGGLFYQRLEIFGTQTVFIHDIELVHDILSERKNLDERDPRIPFARTESESFAFRPAPGGSREYPVVDSAARVVFPGFLELLRALVAAESRVG